MSNQIIVQLSLFLIYYHISGLATTNILRLTTGNTQPVLFPHCHCDACGARIHPLLQLPILSYVICGGKCRNCQTKIPLFPLWMEIVVWSGMSILSALMKYTFAGVGVSFLFYELVRIITILLLGRRSSQFIKQYIIAVLAMIPFYCCALFVALLYKIV